MGTEGATMVLRGAGVVACLLVALASGANPDGEQAIAQSINEAIDAQMQDAAAAGKGQAATAMADLAEYTHGTKSHRCEKRAIAAIRGMSQTKMAVSDLSDTELKFARDSEEAKDIMDQTAQAASLDEKQRKQEEAASIKAQLAKAQETLTRATHESEELGESDDDDDDSSDIDTHTEEDPSDRGPWTVVSSCWRMTRTIQTMTMMTSSQPCPAERAWKSHRMSNRLFYSKPTSS